MRAIDQEIAVKDRHTLAVVLGRIGDPRIVDGSAGAKSYWTTSGICEDTGGHVPLTVMTNDRL